MYILSVHAGGDAMADEAWVGLAEAIQVLREELAAASVAGADEALRFELGPVEVEFTVTVRRDGGARAAVHLGVVSVGAKGGLSADSTHRVKLVLQPTDALTGRPPHVSGRVAEIPPR